MAVRFEGGAVADIAWGVVLEFDDREEVLFSRLIFVIAAKACQPDPALPNKGGVKYLVNSMPSWSLDLMWKCFWPE